MLGQLITGLGLAVAFLANSIALGWTVLGVIDFLAFAWFAILGASAAWAAARK